MKPMILLKPLLFLILILLIMVVSMNAIVGMGYLLATFFPLTLFQAVAISMGTTLIIAFLGVGITICVYLAGIARALRESYEEEFDEDDEDYEEFEDDGMNEKLRHRFDKRLQIVNPSKTGRNTPCPCGSGKKYKLCCGKN